jgi:cytochrome P450
MILSGKWTSDKDLLSMMLGTEYFSANEEGLIDELLTIFFAGSQTSAKAS